MPARVPRLPTRSGVADAVAALVSKPEDPRSRSRRRRPAEDPRRADRAQRRPRSIEWARATNGTVPACRGVTMLDGCRRRNRTDASGPDQRRDLFERSANAPAAPHRGRGSTAGGRRSARSTIPGSACPTAARAPRPCPAPDALRSAAAAARHRRASTSAFPRRARRRLRPEESAADVRVQRRAADAELRRRLGRGDPGRSRQLILIVQSTLTRSYMGASLRSWQSTDWKASSRQRRQLSLVDGERGELVIAGFPVDELAEHATFEETTWLLWHGDLPSAAQLDAFRARSRSRAHSGVDARAAPRLCAHGMSTPWTPCAWPQERCRSSPDEATGIVARVPTIVASYWRLLAADTSRLRRAGPRPRRQLPLHAERQVSRSRNA